jgi:hypothetical protein
MRDHSFPSEKNLPNAAFIKHDENKNMERVRLGWLYRPICFITGFNERSTNQSPFDSIRKLDEQGNEYWSAKELAPLLGYSSWQNFETAIEKAKIACQKSGNNPTQCFNAVIKTSPMPKGGVKESKDYHLSRLACYLIAQNGNPRMNDAT